jgi:acyl dehydratase
MSAAPLPVGTAIETRRFGPFQADTVQTYAAASGDDNPLHTDPAVAMKAGLARSPIHGMLIMGCFETYLRDWRPEVQVVKLAGKFLRPVLVGDGIEIAGKVVKAEADAPAVLRLTVRGDNGKDIACVAEAFVRL